MKEPRISLFVTVERRKGTSRRGFITVRDDRGLALGGIVRAELATGRDEKGILRLEIAESALAGVYFGAPKADDDYNDLGHLWR